MDLLNCLESGVIGSDDIKTLKKKLARLSELEKNRDTILFKWETYSEPIEYPDQYLIIENELEIDLPKRLKKKLSEFIGTKTDLLLELNMRQADKIDSSHEKNIELERKLETIKYQMMSIGSMNSRRRKLAAFKELESKL